MVAQQYDNTWLYTKDLTKRFDADNRLDYGISKDLVADAIKDFGIKLYSKILDNICFIHSFFRTNTIRKYISFTKYDLLHTLLNLGLNT